MNDESSLDFQYQDSHMNSNHKFDSNPDIGELQSEIKIVTSSKGFFSFEVLVKGEIKKTAEAVLVVSEKLDAYCRQKNGNQDF